MPVTIYRRTNRGRIGFPTGTRTMFVQVKGTITKKSPSQAYYIFEYMQIKTHYGPVTSFRPAVCLPTYLISLALRFQPNSEMVLYNLAPCTLKDIPPFQVTIAFVFIALDCLCDTIFFCLPTTFLSKMYSLLFLQVLFQTKSSQMVFYRSERIFEYMQTKNVLRVRHVHPFI